MQLSKLISLPRFDSGILDPRDTCAEPAEWDKKAKELATLYIENLVRNTIHEQGTA